MRRGMFCQRCYCPPAAVTIRRISSRWSSEGTRILNPGPGLNARAAVCCRVWTSAPWFSSGKQYWCRPPMPSPGHRDYAGGAPLSSLCRAASRSVGCRRAVYGPAPTPISASAQQRPHFSMLEVRQCLHRRSGRGPLALRAVRANERTDRVLKSLRVGEFRAITKINFRIAPRG